MLVKKREQCSYQVIIELKDVGGKLEMRMHFIKSKI